MKVLVVGSGGREHCLLWKILQSDLVSRAYCLPGNAGTQRLAATDTDRSVAEFVEEKIIDLVVFGNEGPLVAGAGDEIRAMGRLAVGPSKLAAQLEGSKSFAKQIMLKAGVPTARHRTVYTTEQAMKELKDVDLPVVLKTDGLAAGKGVIIAETYEAAVAAVHELLPEGLGILVIAEFLVGEELSYIVLTDGQNFRALPPSQDHKRLLDNDLGPNTGGMGASSDDGLLTAEQRLAIDSTVIQPVLRTMRERGTPFSGFLYAGLMMTASGVKVLEFNARLGDPETQVILPRLRGDFVEQLIAAAEGHLSSGLLSVTPDPAVTVVAASYGYPAMPRVGDEIRGVTAAEHRDCQVFLAGAQRLKERLMTSGGRVLAVTATGEDLGGAITKAYEGLGEIRFEGMQFRRDIGQRGLRTLVDR